MGLVFRSDAEFLKKVDAVLAFAHIPITIGYLVRTNEAQWRVDEQKIIPEEETRGTSGCLRADPFIRATALSQ